MQIYASLVSSLLSVSGKYHIRIVCKFDTHKNGEYLYLFAPRVNGDIVHCVRLKSKSFSLFTIHKKTKKKKKISKCCEKLSASSSISFAFCFRSMNKNHVALYGNLCLRWICASDCRIYWQKEFTLNVVIVMVRVCVCVLVEWCCLRPIAVYATIYVTNEQTWPKEIFEIIHTNQP